MKQSQSSYRLASRRGALLVAALFLLGSLSFIPQAAWATSSCLGTLTVTVSATGVTFGNYDVMNAAATPGTGSTTVSATCNFSNLPFTVSYSTALSTGGSGSFTPRSMAAGAPTLQYNLYTTAALTTIWGDGTGGTQTVSDTINGTCQNQFFGFGINCSGSQRDTMYGNIPALQDVVPGSYTDNITVTVTF